MRKKTIAIISTVAVAILILALVLSSEITGVPKKQILADLDEELYVTPINVSLKHNVDPALHTDTVTVKYDIQEVFATFHHVEEYRYFYDKSLDIWELKGIKSVSGKCTLSEHLEDQIFRGKADSDHLLYPPDISYEIKVNNVDYEHNSVQIKYTIKTSEETYNGLTELNFNDTYEVARLLEIRFNAKGLSVSYN